MIFIILIVIAVLAYSIIKPLSNKTKIPAVLFFILVGILFSKDGIYDLFGELDKINPQTKELAKLSSFAVITLFIISGLNLNLDAIKSSRKSTFILASLPVLGEGLIMGIVSYFMFILLPNTEFHFSIFAFWTVMIIFAMSSHGIIIPLILNSKQKGKNSPFLSKISLVSVMDNFLALPLVLLFIILSTTIGVGVVGSRSGISGVLGILGVVLVGVVVAYVVGHLFGVICGTLFNKVHTDKLVLSLILIIGTILLAIITDSVDSGLGIMIGIGTGIGFNITVKKGSEKSELNSCASRVYNLFLMPLIFIYVGTQIQIDLLLNLTNIVCMLIITVLAIFIKGTISGLYLKSQGYTRAEQELSGTLFAAKGTILIKMSLVIAPAFTFANLQNVLQYMYILGVISIIISVPYSVLMSKKLIKKIS